ncbi:hypothetical protein T02_6573 [Trichinella nativa]|uniref:Uncharacterized protein n=1 Tax=Trichinella nativa TaxID=6335 RepID=A0A0V1KXA1_9BILA|nr:hypothetical protein T02_6573 [Trichinella nativa]
MCIIEQDRKSMKANRKFFIRGVDLASSTSGRHFSYYNDAVHWSDLVRADQRSSNVAQSTGTADRSFHNTAETLVHKILLSYWFELSEMVDVRATWRQTIVHLPFLLFAFKAESSYASFGKASLKACLLSYSLSEVSRGVSVVWPRRIPFKLKRVVHEYETIFQLSHCPFSNASIHLHKVATLNKITTVGKFCSTPTNWTTANLVARFGVKHQIGLAKTRSNSKPLFNLRFFELLLSSVFCCKT